MQTLETPTTKIEYDLEKELKTAVKKAGGMVPTKVRVDIDIHHQAVFLFIGEKKLTLSTKQAWDLAREIRKAANRLGSGAFESKKK